MDAVICLGCIIQGETRHFDFIADATANGIMNVGLQTNTPVIFGVLNNK
jgi:6,7-dimethyl-8-ribityllumazine synthase